MLVCYRRARGFLACCAMAEIEAHISVCNDYKRLGSAVALDGMTFSVLSAR